jgi:pimeloyl-ACP methyl ester carboxylesterase
MYSQTSTKEDAAFDEIYRKVPSEQVARLKEFRDTHPYKQLIIGDKKWEYISCGRGKQALLLLPGALSVGESMFPFINGFENEYHIVAPSYALSLTMKGLCEGIADILKAEDLNEAHVFGGSYGGLVAQYFVRQYPAKARSLILSHTFVLTPKPAKPLWIAGKLFPAFPKSLFVPILKLRLNKMLLSKLRAANHPKAEFWRAYLNEAIASRVWCVRTSFLSTVLPLVQHPASSFRDRPAHTSQRSSRIGRSAQRRAAPSSQRGTFGSP